MIRSTTLRLSIAAAFAALVLTACGGGGGSGPGLSNGTTTGSSSGSDIPQSAQDSIAGLLAYVNTVIASMTSDSSEPLVVGNAVLPVSDTAEPGN